MMIYEVYYDDNYYYFYYYHQKFNNYDYNSKKNNKHKQKKQNPALPLHTGAIDHIGRQVHHKQRWRLARGTQKSA